MPATIRLSYGAANILLNFQSEERKIYLWNNVCVSTIAIMAIDSKVYRDFVLDV
jgi:hypothetical protein